MLPPSVRRFPCHYKHPLLHYNHHHARHNRLHARALNSPPQSSVSMRAEVLREKGGFTAPDFTIFRGVLTDFLKQPKNHLGLEGPGRHVSQRQQAWEEWLDEFIDEKIGRMFWGQGTTRKWSYPAERDK